jgi:hypothetical protein
MSQRLEISGHGDYEARDLATLDANIRISGHGGADVWVGGE